MSTEVVVALIVFAGGSLTTLANILISRRRHSGNISTSDAVSLWAESNALREDYKNQAATNLARAEKAEEQIRKNNEQLASLSQKLSEAMDEFTKFRSDSAKSSEAMKNKIDELKRIIKNLQAQNQRLLASKKGKK